MVRSWLRKKKNRAKLKKSVKKTGSGFLAFGKAAMSGIGKANKALDKIGYPKIDPMSMVGAGKPQQKLQEAKKQPQAQPTRKAKRELTFCPICGWVPAPHKHKLVEI